jgi:multidrug efflux pump subunit AcrA (membrane-fusion protein)
MSSSPAPKAREDLEYFEREIDGDDVVLVRDPVRGTYFRFNALQGAMLQALDGKRTPAEITAALSERFEVEIPPVAAERFIGRARDLMLLDIAAYTTTSKAACLQIEKALRKAGFWNHASGLHATRSAETAQLAHAFTELERGHPRAAAAYLTTILDTDPGHARAKQLRDLIQTAFIRSVGGTSEFPTFVLFNPSRMLTWLSRTIGGFLFSWMGILTMLAFICVGVHAYTQVLFESITLGPVDLLIVFVALLISNLFHESAHGLACQHYGGNVTEIGVTLMYFVQPAAYCDTSSSYTITSRRHLVIIQMAGCVASLVFLSMHSMLVAVLRPSLPIYSGLALGLLISTTVVFFNLIPLLKLDGYYALCDYVGFPNLRDRSFTLTRAWLSERLLGITIPTEELPARTRTLLITYAIAAYVFTAWFIYYGYTRLLAPFVEQLRGGGLVLAIAFGVYVLRNITLRPVWRFACLLVRERRRIFTPQRTTIWFLILAAVIGPWLLPWPVLVDNEFVIVPRERAEIRAQTAGRVHEILVKEGARVQRGQAIATLRNAALHAQITALEAELEVASYQIDRVRRGARPEELELARRQLDHARSEVWRSAREAAVATRLAKASLGTQASADTARGRVAGATGTAGAAEWGLSLLAAGARPEDITAAEAGHARVAAQLAQLHSDEALLTLRSPIDGVMITTHLEDKLQAMLAPGELFAEVQDLGSVVAEIPLAQSDPLAELAIGNEVALRAYGLSRDELRARIARFREVAQDKGGQPRVVAITTPFVLDVAVSGLTGHARIYGERRSLAYAHLYLPLQRLLRVRMWSKW